MTMTAISACCGQTGSSRTGKACKRAAQSLRFFPRLVRPRRPGLQPVFRRVRRPCRGPVNGSLELCNLPAVRPEEGVGHPQELPSLASTTWVLRTTS